MSQSDIEVLRSLFEWRGVKYAEAETNEAPFFNGRVPGHVRANVVARRKLTVTVDYESVVGYSGFETDLYFDLDGALITLGLWE